MSRTRADDRHARPLQWLGQIEWRLPAKLHNHPDRFLLLVDVQYVLERQRLKKKFVRSIVIGRDGLGIGVDHDRLISQLFEGKRGMNAAIIELDALADAIRTAAENHDSGFGAASRFVFVTVGRVVIRCIGLEFGGAGIDQSVGGHDAEAGAQRADFWFGCGGEVGQLAVGEAEAFGGAHATGGRESFWMCLQREFFLDDLAHLREEPRVNFRQLMDFVLGERALIGAGRGGAGGGAAETQRLRRPEDSFGIGHAELALDGRPVGINWIFSVGAQSGATGFQASQRFLQAFFKRAADGHGLTHALHLGGQHGIGIREFFKRESRHFGDDVIDGRFKARGCFAGDVIADFVQPVSDGEFGGNFGNRETCGFGSEG